MKRLAQTIRLRPERREEYLKLHSAVRPAVEAAMWAANIRNFSIFLREDTLFGYLEYHGEDFEADMARLEADPQTQEWWKLTDPCQQPWSDSDRQWSVMDEIWHQDETRQS